VDNPACVDNPVTPSITGATRLVGVMGDPIRHSKSPALLNAAFAAAGLDYVMAAFPVSSGDAAAGVGGLRSLGVVGCSVTMPHKAAVIPHLDGISGAARALDAVNCITTRNGSSGQELWGENTDGVGFIRGLADDTGFDVHGKRCAVVGAGGAARAVIYALADAGATHIDVINRTESAAVSAAALAGGVGHVGDPGDIGAADLVVQATSIGMKSNDSSAVDPALFGAGHVVAELIYHPAITPTMRAAVDAGATVSNGLSMLIHQAAVAFEHWTGVEAPIAAMRSAVTQPTES
jgi:shikimate dehydrogenase